MSHGIIIRGNYEAEHAPVKAELEWWPADDMPFEHQVKQFRKMLRIYLKARAVGGDPAGIEIPDD